MVVDALEHEHPAGGGQQRAGRRLGRAVGRREHAPVELEADRPGQHVRAGRVHRERRPGQIGGQLGQPGRDAEHRPRRVRRGEQPPHHRHALGDDQTLATRPVRAPVGVGQVSEVGDPRVSRVGDLVHPGRLSTACRTDAAAHDPVTEPPVRPGSRPTVAYVRTTVETTPDIAVGTVSDPPRPTSAPPRGRAPRRRSGGGVIFLPPWTRAPFLPFKQPAVILAVLGAALILACASSSGVLFLSSASSESLHRLLAVQCPDAGYPAVRATQVVPDPAGGPARFPARRGLHRPLGDDRGRPRRPLPGSPGRADHPGGPGRPDDRRPDLLPGRRDQPDHPGRPHAVRSRHLAAGRDGHPAERAGRVAGVVLDLRRGPGGGVPGRRDLPQPGPGAGPAVLVLVHEPVPEPELRQRLGAATAGDRHRREHVPGRPGQLLRLQHGHLGLPGEDHRHHADPGPGDRRQAGRGVRGGRRDALAAAGRPQLRQRADARVRRAHLADPGRVCAGRCCRSRWVARSWRCCWSVRPARTGPTAGPGRSGCCPRAASARVRWRSRRCSSWRCRRSSAPWPVGCWPAGWSLCSAPARCSTRPHPGRPRSPRSSRSSPGSACSPSSPDCVPAPPPNGRSAPAAAGPRSCPGSCWCSPPRPAAG